MTCTQQLPLPRRDTGPKGGKTAEARTGCAGEGVWPQSLISPQVQNPNGEPEGGGSTPGLWPSAEGRGVEKPEQKAEEGAVWEVGESLGPAGDPVGTGGSDVGEEWSAGWAGG